MKKITLTFLTFLLTFTLVKAYVVGTVTYESKKYYVDVRVEGYSANIWLVQNKNMCTVGDMNVLKLIASNPNYKAAKAKVCRAKSIYDDGKTIAGCTATAMSGVCLAATVASDGATAGFCIATWTYTAKRGLADCVKGVSSKIGNYLGVSKWSQLAIKAGLTTLKWNDVISTAIDNACEDVNK
jgi:hypothetical protein